MYEYDFSRKRLAILCEQQNHRCCYCGTRFDEVGPSLVIRGGVDTRASIEHVKRLADGGTREWANEVAACRGCNSARGARSAHQFHEILSTNTEFSLSHRYGMRRFRPAADRKAGPALVQSKRVGKWPPSLGEVAMTEERAAYFEMVYGPWRRTG